MIKINKKLLLIALILVLIISIVSSVYAIPDTSIYELKPEVEGDTGEFADMASKVLGIITVVGILVAVGGIMVLGIQTMTASAAEKAVYKQKFLPFIVGLAILISATGIVSTILNVVTGKGGGTPSPENPHPRPPYDPGTPVDMPY